MAWSHQWTLKVDGTNLNDHVKYVCTVPELQSIAPGRVVLAQIDGDYPAFIRRQPAEGSFTFLIAMKNASTDVLWDERLAELTALFDPTAYHTLAAQIRGMGTEQSARFVVESMQVDYKTRTVVVFTTAPNPVLA